MKISIIGAGYVGLVTGVCLAEKGHSVVCVDTDRVKVATINAGNVPFHETGLPQLLRGNLGARFRATENLEHAVLQSEITFIAVGTPFDGSKIDLSAVTAAAGSIGQAIAGKSSPHAVIVKSTVVPGTTDSLVRTTLEAASGRTVGPQLMVGVNPEFLTEGQAVSDFMDPDRIVLGGDEDVHQILSEVYRSFAHTHVIRTNNRTAEMIKYASNAFLATQISFINEIANLCSAIGGVDVRDVSRGLVSSRYLRTPTGDGTFAQASISSFLEAGCGFGGSCLPKDVAALIAQGVSLGRSMDLLKAVIETNRSQPREMMRALRRHFANVNGLRVAVLGLAFKPDTDDIRESPAFAIIDMLLSEGAAVTVWDPAAMQNAAQLLQGKPVRFADSLESALQATDAVLLVTRWDQFKSVPELLRGVRNQPLVIDGRRMLEPSSVARYDGIGMRVEEVVS